GAGGRGVVVAAGTKIWPVPVVAVLAQERPGTDDLAGSLRKSIAHRLAQVIADHGVRHGAEVLPVGELRVGAQVAVARDDPRLEPRCLKLGHHLLGGSFASPACQSRLELVLVSFAAVEGRGAPGGR